MKIFKNITIRTRVTILTVLLLVMCCIGLTIVLNRSAYKMANDLQIPLTDITIAEAGIVESADALSIPQTTAGESGTGTSPALETYPAQLTIAKYKDNSVLYMFAFIIIGGGVMYALIYHALRPLGDLTKQIQEKNPSNLADKIPVRNARDEIYELTQSFNEMTESLGKAFEMQKRFANNAAHELRTPIATMRTSLEVFEKKNAPLEGPYEELIHKQVNHLTRLSDVLSNLLQFTNMEDIDLGQQVKLERLLLFVIDDLTPIAKEKEIQITTDLDEITIAGNYDLLYQVFYNLIENAIKYNKENGSIDISIKKGEKVQIIIKDTGIGIPECEKELIFEPFYTVNKSHSRKLGGAGIGLSIVQSVLEKHKSVITVMDNPQGGTIFHITFES